MVPGVERPEVLRAHAAATRVEELEPDGPRFRERERDLEIA